MLIYLKQIVHEPYKKIHTHTTATMMQITHMKHLLFSGHPLKEKTASKHLKTKTTARPRGIATRRSDRRSLPQRPHGSLGAPVRRRQGRGGGSLSQTESGRCATVHYADGCVQATKICKQRPQKSWVYVDEPIPLLKKYFTWPRFCVPKPT